MSPQVRIVAWVLAWAGLLTTGCAPTRPHFFHDDGDESHYKHVATDIEYPDVESCTLDEVSGAAPPVTAQSIEEREPWPLSMEEAVRTALANSKVVRQLGAGASTSGVLPADNLLRNPDIATTVYDPAITETDPRQQGVEAALSEFDAQLAGTMLWQKNDRPFNRRTDNNFSSLFQPITQQDLGTFGMELSKQSVTGSRFSLRNDTVYDWNNDPSRLVASDWTTSVTMEATQPLLRGAGVQFNRIAGPITSSLGSTIRPFSGVVIARINNDISLADFEANVLNQVSDVENTYRELYYAYRFLEAQREGRDSALESWRDDMTKEAVGTAGKYNVARSRQQYFQFKAQFENALWNVFEIESRLRYLMGLAASDCRIIRPSDEPSTAHIEFDWCTVQAEALARVVNLRRQKWQIKKSELELIAARNFLLPQLDGIARYRFLGVGDDLLDPNGRGFPDYQGSNAVSTLADGDFQEWELGLQLAMPIGFRRELSAVRHYQLRLARQRALLQDQELEVSHLLGDAIRNLHRHYALMETNFNLWLAADEQLKLADALYKSGAGPSQDNPVDPKEQVLQAQRNRVQAKTDYFRALVNYNKAITEIHYRKGSLLEYNNVFLAEGPWPCKAYFDSHKRARERDAGCFVNYGFTRPSVFSRGPYGQFQHPGPEGPEEGYEYAAEGVPTPAADAPVETPEGYQPTVPDTQSEPDDAELPGPLSDEISLPTGERGALRRSP